MRQNIYDIDWEDVKTRVDSSDVSRDEIEEGVCPFCEDEFADIHSIHLHTSYDNNCHPLHIYYLLEDGPISSEKRDDYPIEFTRNSIPLQVRGLIRIYNFSTTGRGSIEVSTGDANSVYYFDAHKTSTVIEKIIESNKDIFDNEPIRSLHRLLCNSFPNDTVTEVLKEKYGHRENWW